MKRTILRAVAICALLVAPAIAQAAEGFSTANVNMRSGPSTAYPAVVVIPNGAPLTIHGCLADTPWCDVSFARGRGWVAGSYIQAIYRQNRVYVGPEYYRGLGIPTIGFDLDNYWDRNYRGRDFYRDRDRWSRGPDRRDFDRRPPPPPPRYRDYDRRDDFGRGPPPREDFGRGPPPREDFGRGPPPRRDNDDDYRRGPPPRDDYRRDPDQGRPSRGDARPPRGDDRPDQGRPPRGDDRPDQARPPRGDDRPDQNQNRPPRGDARPDRVRPDNGTPDTQDRDRPPGPRSLLRNCAADDITCS